MGSSHGTAKSAMVTPPNFFNMRFNERDSESKYVCPLASCGFTTSYRRNVKRHIERRHPDLYRNWIINPQIHLLYGSNFIFVLPFFAASLKWGELDVLIQTLPDEIFDFFSRSHWSLIFYSNSCVLLGYEMDDQSLEKRFDCPNCRRSYKHKQHLYRHLRQGCDEMTSESTASQRDGQSSYIPVRRCNLCSYVTYLRASLLQHIQNKHWGSSSS